VDRLTRKELKTDKFAQEVSHSVEFMAEHRRQITRYGTAAVVILVIAVAIYGYMQYRKTEAHKALNAALDIQNATVGPQAPDGSLTFATQDEKDKALVKALSNVASKYGSMNEGDIAHYYLGTYNADKGNMSEAEKQFKVVVDSGNKNYASLAKLALADIYQSEGKQAEGEKFLRSLIDNPTIFFSKEEATIALARYIAPTNPQQARKLLEPLRADRSAVSRVALSVLSEIPQK
jgi:predicted negative regulator of RcsB-dependent stress response